MNLIKYIRQKRENLSSNLCLPLVPGVTDNNATTKLLAAMPSRHPLAFFAPKIHKATNFVMTTEAKRHIYFSLQNFRSEASYGGLIRPNKRPFMGNKSSRLVTVVETRPPLLSVGIQTTKLLGVASNG